MNENKTADIWKIMADRHSVRQYTDRKIEMEKRTELEKLAEACNRGSGMHIQLIYDEPGCFDSMMAHYGKFKGVSNYIAMVGRKDAPDLEEKCGYFGEKIVLKAQELGLNTCWVALTYGKRKCRAVVKKEEKLCCVIALGYGSTQGVPRPSKSVEQVSDYQPGMPEWYKKGIEAALLAPTAMNQQKFYFTYNDGKVLLKAGKGFYTKMDLGIVKYHFRLASGYKFGGRDA
ncbi:MAG TPA: nitroreductase [Candidatus Blautia gallistercoris]|uniref:Nitroreductase n=1 Tax=Candidatus Blautia gallistercoris TaxID=2838490 RepID=A0A9D2B283_9FIRM|nr:nitroreductase [Candidatus Blautia gallistercoris]